MKKENVEKLKSATIVILILIIVFGASYFTSELQACNNIETDMATSSTGLNEISIDDYLSLKDGEEASIIYIARPTCSFCQQEEPIIEEIVSEYGVTVNYLNTDNLNNDGLTDLVQSDEYFSEGFGTPLLMVVEKNEIKEVLEGLKDKDTIVDFFKKYGFISE